VIGSNSIQKDLNQTLSSSVRLSSNRSTNDQQSADRVFGSSSSQLPITKRMRRNNLESLSKDKKHTCIIISFIKAMSTILDKVAETILTSLSISYIELTVIVS